MKRRDYLEIRGQEENIQSIVKIGQNTEKNPGDLKRFVVTQALMKNHQLTLLGRNSQRSKIIIKRKKERKKEK